LDPRQWFTMGAQPEQALLVARALCGDDAAVADVKQALAVMTAHDQYLGEQLAIRNRSETLMRNDPASIDPERLVLVHATSFEPQRGTDGSVELRTRFDTTGYARASLHFTLNHRVVSHMYGQWDGSGYVVVAPYAGAQGRNGDPANLLGVDTWWQCNPGEAVALPGAVVVRLDPNVHDLMTRVGRDVVVKSSNFTEADIATLQAAGVLDLDAVEATIQNQLEYKAIEAADVAGVREALIAGAARDLAVDTSIVELGGSITFGGDWACGLEPEITALAHERGLAHSAHCNAPSYDAESLNGSFFGHEPRTGHSGGLLRADSATRRVAIAAGVVAPPTPQRVVARDGFDSLAFG